MEKINDTEMKARFFAQYIDQEVLITPHLIWSGNPPEPEREEWGEEILNIENIKKVLDFNFPLWLKPLPLISDEDAIEVAIQNRVPREATDEVKVRVGKDILKRVFEDTQSNMCIPFETADYLRSKGYALPFNQYSVEQLVELGWIKLEES